MKGGEKYPTKLYSYNTKELTWQKHLNMGLSIKDI